ncbi:MAG TPA: cupredoxin domain-containing protein [Actinomycetota bacterium]|nr:cupredoxin domain-containing protein [Actinomycetota bacterium]
MSTPEEQATPTTAPEAATGLTWHKLAAWAAWAIPVVFILLMVVHMEFLPFFIPFIVVFGGLGWWVSRGGRWSGIVLAVLAVVFIAMNAPFVIPTLAVPASPIDFISTVWILLAAITAVVAGIMAFRSSASSSGARAWQRVVAGFAVVVVIVSVVAMATYDDAAQQEGDLELTAADIEFKEESLDADSGTVAVFITNEDRTYHTFTIDELDVHVDIPQGAMARVEFDAEAGEYEFYCVPHEADMKGTLTVQ